MVYRARACLEVRLRPTIVGLNLTPDQALSLYTIVAKGDQVALYLHDPKR